MTDKLRGWLGGLVAVMGLMWLMAAPTAQAATTKAPITFGGYSTTPRRMRGTWYSYDRQAHRYDKLVITAHSVTGSFGRRHLWLGQPHFVIAKLTIPGTPRASYSFAQNIRGFNNPNWGRTSYQLGTLTSQGRRYAALVEGQWSRRPQVNNRFYAWTHVKRQHVAIPASYRG